jgi:thiamine pyrophosphate-dependent acetolactate synthase large subunit-like protein
VRRIYSLSGNQIMPVYDACIDAGIEIVHTRHEAAAVFMADATAQLTGHVGVALVTAAPGFANALGPLYTARASESPVVLLSGDAPTSHDQRGGFQELDQAAMSAPLTKLSMRASSAAQLGTDVARAVRTALSGRPGPVHLALPFDVVEDEADGAAIASETSLLAEPMAVSAEDIAALQEALAAAERPLILTGPAMNASRAGALLRHLADAAASPVVAMESPRGLNDPSLGNIRQAFAEADLIVSLGKAIDFTMRFGAHAICDEHCRWLVVSADAAERDRAHRNLGARLVGTIAADPRAVATALADGNGGARTGWRSEVADRIAARSFDAAEAPSGKITPAALCAVVQKHLDAAEHPILISDGGEFGQWAQACLSGPRRLINGPSGAIGGSLCYGIAAKKAEPGATVIAMMGDGTAGFHFSEFETAAREGAPFVAVIGNDACWNAEHQIQMRRYGPNRLIGCALSEARYDQAAAGLGGHGEFVTELADLDGALARAIASGKPACVNVMMEGLPAPAAPG